MPRFVPPAGTPLRMGQVAASVRAAISFNGHRKEFVSVLSQRLGVKRVFAASSGRAGLWLILRSLHRIQPERDVVALPAYTCFSVPAAVARARLKIAPIDIDPHTFELDCSQVAALPERRLLCVIGCNLFGFPSDFSSILEITRAKGAYVVDDAAQALGASRNGRLAGTLGDVGLYSLGRGKALGSIEGGLIVTNSEEIADALQSEVKSLGAPSLLHGTGLLFEMVAYSVLLRPSLYWIPNSVPFLGLGTTRFNPSFATDELHPLSMGLLPSAMADLERVNEIRRRNACAVAEALEGTEFELPSPAAGSLPTFVRLPVLACNRTVRDRVVARLRHAGIGASTFYPGAICDIEGIDPYMAEPGVHRKTAESLSEKLFTLPVHPLVTSKDVERIGETVRALSTEIS